VAVVRLLTRDDLLSEFRFSDSGAMRGEEAGTLSLPVSFSTPIIPSTILLSCNVLSFDSSGALTSSRFLAKLLDDVLAAVPLAWKRPMAESLSRTLVLETCPVVSSVVVGDEEEDDAVVVVVVVVVVDLAVDVSDGGVTGSSWIGSVECGLVLVVSSGLTGLTGGRFKTGLTDDEVSS
jgi:hypothetical protein